MLRNTTFNQLLYPLLVYIILLLSFLYGFSEFIKSLSDCYLVEKVRLITSLIAFLYSVLLLTHIVNVICPFYIYLIIFECRILRYYILMLVWIANYSFFTKFTLLMILHYCNRVIAGLRWLLDLHISKKYILILVRMKSLH